MAVAQIGSLITFVAGNTAVAADVNTNFTDIRNAFNNLVTGSNAIGVDVIAEVSAAAGVTVDGVLLKDALVGPTYGGTGISDPTAKGAMIAQGSNPMTLIAPGSSGNVLKSDGTDWASGSVPGGLAVWSEDGSGHLVPDGSRTRDIGTSSLFVREGFFDGITLKSAAGTPVDAFLDTTSSFFRLGTTSDNRVEFFMNNAARWWIREGSGHLQPAAGNTYDIGSGSGLELRTGYFGTSVVVDDGTVTMEMQANSSLGKIGTTSNHTMSILSNNVIEVSFGGARMSINSSSFEIGAVGGTFVNKIFANEVHFAVAGVRIQAGTGTPEGNLSAPVGAIWMRSDGGAGTSMYVKESGTGNTGWVAK